MHDSLWSVDAATITKYLPYIILIQALHKTYKQSTTRQQQV